jgi:membrane fusion protein, copper/silver efflux system
VNWSGCENRKGIDPMRRPILIVLLLVLLTAAFLAGTRYSRSASTASGRKVLYYVDPMHPAYKSDKPGIAPDCGMELEPVYADSEPLHTEAHDNDSTVSGAVHISSEKKQIIGVQVVVVEKTSGTHTLRTLGRVALDETRVFRVTTSVDGLVRAAGPIVTGSMVKNDELLGTFYNRDFLTAQQTYLYALNTMDRFKNNDESADQLKLTRAQMQAAEENLEFLGMGETQIKEVARTRQIARNIELRSPIAGLVIARNTFAGLRFDRGTELFRIADLSHVWIVADVFKDDVQHFQPGMIASVVLPGGHETLRAKVSDSLPQFDPNTRTMKVRLEVDNPDFILRPDMFVDIELPTRVPPGLSVPVDALLDSGLKKRVFIDRGNGFFEPREVETGWRLGDRVQIVSGLKTGDRVVVSGTFLMDSESRLKATSAGNSGPQMEAPAMQEVAGHHHSEAGMAKTKKAAVHWVKDLSCGMDIDPAKATAEGNSASYRGMTYYFCSKSCKSKFEKDPERYPASRQQGSHHD